MKTIFALLICVLSTMASAQDYWKYNKYKDFDEIVGDNGMATKLVIRCYNDNRMTMVLHEQIYNQMYGSGYQDKGRNFTFIIGNTIWQHPYDIESMMGVRAFYDNWDKFKNAKSLIVALSGEGIVTSFNTSGLKKVLIGRCDNINPS